MDNSKRKFDGKDLMIVLLIFAFVILLFMFIRSRNDESVRNKSFYEQQTLVIKRAFDLLDKNISTNEAENKYLDSYIAEKRRADSLTILLINANRVKYTGNEKRLKDIADNAGRLTKDELRREYAKPE